MSPCQKNRKFLAGHRGSKMSTGSIFLESCAAALSQKKCRGPVSSMKEMGSASDLTYAWSMLRRRCFQSCLWPQLAGLHLLSAETSACGKLPGKGYFASFF